MKIDIIDISREREYKLKVSGNQLSERNLTDQTVHDITITNKKTAFKVFSSGHILK